MRDRGLFAIVLAIVAGVFFLPGAPRRAEQASTNVVQSAAGQAAAGAEGVENAGAHDDTAHRQTSRHGGEHPHVSSAMLLLLADYLALDPHPEASGAKAAHAHADEEELSDAQADRLSHEIRDAAESGGLTIEPLIVTLPDPIESHAKWMFDRYLDGLARGIAASGYVMDRYGPESWWASGNPHAGDGGSGGGGAAAERGGHHHEGEPGVILFRTTNGKRLLVLLIVTETATAGIQAHAAMTAFDSAANLLALQPRANGNVASSNLASGICCSPEPDRTLKLVGPTFSGSAVSLRTAVNGWLSVRTDGCWGLRIVSGAVSSVVSRNTLGIWDKRITFQATVPDDEAMQDAVFSYLKNINGGHGERVAWLVEDNTTFGASLNPTAVSRVRTNAAQAAVVKAALAQAAATQAANEAAIARNVAKAAPVATEPGTAARTRAAAPPAHAHAEPPAPTAPAAPTSMGALCAIEPPAEPPPARVRPGDDFELVVIPFPMHVSRLHTAAEDERAQARSKSAFAPQPIVPLRLTDTGSPRDAFPAMTPELTFASVERALASLLDTIHSEHIRFVSIMATDTRDKLFLAEQIAQRAPDSLLFTFTTDILYLHPDVNDNVRGMLVASAYPLNPVTQPWTPHDPSSVLQMQHNTEQGIYNAALAILGTPSPDTPVSNSFAPLLDYGAPGPIRATQDEVTGPAIWVSSVGRDTFWPVAIYDMRESHAPFESFNDPRLIKVRTSRVPRYPVPHLTLSPWACALFVALSVIALLHVGAYALAWWRERPTRANVPAPAAASVDDENGAIVWNDCNTAHRRAPVTVYQLVCIVALWTFFTIPVTLSIIWLKAETEVRAINPEGPLTPVVIAWLAALLAMVAWVGLTAVAGALIWTILRRATPYFWKSRREPRGWPTMVRLMLWVIGVIAVGQVAADVVRHLPMTQDGLWAELPYFMRVTTLGNGVSPVVSYFLLCAAFYAWGVMNLRRFATPTPLLCVTLPKNARPRDWRIPLLRGLGFDDPEDLIARFQCRCNDVFLAVPGTFPLALLASAVAIYVVILGPTPLTIEGPTFGLAVVLAMIVLHVITGLAVSQFYMLWRTLHNFLGQLAEDGLLDAFESLGKRQIRVISAGISLRRPRDIDHYLAEHSPLLVHAMAPEAPRTLEPTLASNPGPGSGPGPEPSPHLDDGSPSAWAIVTSRESRESFPPAVFEFLTQRAASCDSQREDLTVATLLAFAIQQILTRLGELLAFASLSTLLVIAAFGAFPFGRGPVLDGFGWLYVFILATTALIVIIQVARDPILGRLKGYDKPGSMNWDREILTKFALYAGIPLLGFISSQFPWLGRLLSQWLQPMQQALPWQ